jgi:kinesin family protein C2/C3
LRESLAKCRDLLLADEVAETLASIASRVEETVAQARNDAIDLDERRVLCAKAESLLRVLREEEEENLSLLKQCQSLHNEVLDAERLRRLLGEIEDLKGAVRVFCRVRPFSAQECARKDENAVEQTGPFTISVLKGGQRESFRFDAIFGPSSSQQEVYDECCSLVDSAVDGHSVTIFSCGQARAGKTHTMYGSSQALDPGITPRICEDIFKAVERQRHRLSSFQVSTSMIELCHNNLQDLLTEAEEPPQLELKRARGPDGRLTVLLEGAVVAPVNDIDDFARLIAKGLSQRKVAGARGKLNSSGDRHRSHVLLMIFLHGAERDTGKTIRGKITIADLAGSDRRDTHLDLSLSALADVMTAMARGKAIPHRTDKLSQLMQESLGGFGAKVLMFVNVSPASSNAEETCNALRYASRARCTPTPCATPAT